ncbi:MAG: hypothetical protein UZ21_OP11001000545 [Microgenomates bacterium OLB22]|nr:MAG: hypothetical protein UZ21_OP11001000545 [Microgenomates bacterium OLB22]
MKQTGDTMQIHSIDEAPISATNEKEVRMPSAVFSIPQTSLIFVLAILLGGVIGYGFTSFSSLMRKAPSTGSDTTAGTKAVKSVGVVDKKTFSDSTEGVMREGGTDGEGSFYLERPGGEDQRAYLTSSVVDLTQFIGKKVRVWGQTFEGQKAGWLMDVGLVELLE